MEQTVKADAGIGHDPEFPRLYKHNHPELGEWMVQRVLATSGDVASVDTRAGLERAGEVAALLRYPSR